MPIFAFCVKYFDTNIGKILKNDDPLSDDANTGRRGRDHVDLITLLITYYLLLVLIKTFDRADIFK